MPDDSQNQTNELPPIDGTVVTSVSPRAFVTGTGYLMQAFGGLILMGSCLIWMIGNFWVSSNPPRVESWSDYFTNQNIPRFAAAAGIVTSFVGALGMMALGVGLQGEKPASAMRACVWMVLMAIVYATLAVLLIVLGPHWLPAIPAALMGVLCMGVMLLAARSVQILKAFPPPENLHEVTDEWVEEYKQRKREARGM